MIEKTIKLLNLLFLISLTIGCMEDEMQDSGETDLTPDFVETGSYAISPADYMDKELSRLLFSIYQTDSSLFSIDYTYIGERLEVFRISFIPLESGVYRINEYDIWGEKPISKLSIYEVHTSADRYTVSGDNYGRLEVNIDQDTIWGNFDVDLTLDEASVGLNYYPDEISIDGWFKAVFKPD